MLGIRKVGHCGTLDPFATGVLLLCTGRATRLVDELTKLEKHYDATVELGRVTDTYDIQGKVTKKESIEGITADIVGQALKEFIGEIEQVPPMYSARKVGGRRLYALAREGLTVERKAQRVYISDIHITEFFLPFVRFSMTCSKGTYVRSLARDLGRLLSVGGYLTQLTRTRVGSYSISEALTLEQFATQVSRF